MWRDLQPLGRDAVDRRIPTLAVRQRRTRVRRLVSRRSAPSATSTSSGTARATRSPGGARPGRRARRHPDRLASGLRRQRRRVRRPARSRVLVRCDRRACASADSRRASRSGSRCSSRRRARDSASPASARGSRPVGSIQPRHASSRIATASSCSMRWQSSGLDPVLGPSAMLDDVELFVELHVEQGRDLIDRGRPVAVASASWAHGRWRFDFAGEPNHAGATRMEDRRDPMLTYAMTALGGQQAGADHRRPGDVRPRRRRTQRHQRDPRARDRVAGCARAACLAGRGAGGQHRTPGRRAIGPRRYDGQRDGRVRRADRRLRRTLWRRGCRALLGDAPIIPTGAGHDAGILQLAGIPSAMLFVRNPTGISHSPEEFAEIEDCLAGVDALVGSARGACGVTHDVLV